MRAEPPDWLDDKETETKLVIEETNTGQWDYNFATDPFVTDLMRTADTVRYLRMRLTFFKSGYCILRQKICRYRLEEALTTMSSITGFDRQLEEFTFKR